MSATLTRTFRTDAKTMGLREYRGKRRFSRTPEPQGDDDASSDRHCRFVVQKHAARSLHYDLRLEWDGVLKSWAIPKGPCFDPREKRLAIQMEDHPLEYLEFEGKIPQGEYGAGAMIVWDRGIWRPLLGDDPLTCIEQGELKFSLHGEKLRGGWTLVRMRTRPGESKPQWLLIKEQDDEVRPLPEFDVLIERPLSTISGRSVEELTAPATKRNRHSRRKKAVPIAEVDGAIAVSMPNVKPQLAGMASATPEGIRWIHEIKFDGYRLQCRIADQKIQMLTRNQLDWTDRFPELVEAAARLSVKSAILDGELVALLPSGASSFQKLQTSLSAGRTGQLVYYVFDLLYLDGFDLCDVPLETRKQILAALLHDREDPRIRYVDHIDGDGPAFFRECCRLGLEGAISKRRDRGHRGGRTNDWLKSKCIQREEFIIGGFTRSTTTRKGLRAILVGYFNRQGQLIYAGRVGSGFSEEALVDLRERLNALKRPDNPFHNLPQRRIERGCYWVRPQLVAQVEFSNWTGDKILRHPVFQGLREDIPSSGVIRDAPQPSTAQTGSKPLQRRQAKKPDRRAPLTASQRGQLAQLRLTHPDRVLYSGQGITKLGLASYYIQISEWILPHLLGRPLTLVRCPSGQGKSQFYQRHATAGTPGSIDRVPLTEHGKTVEYLGVSDLAGLVSLVQMGVLEIHPWAARCDRIDRPDRIILDLDPDPALPWSRVIDAAKLIRERLEFLGLQSFVKTSGSKGLHVVAPIQRRHSWNEVSAFAKTFSQWLAAEFPSQYTASMSKPARQGRVFIDHHRNRRGATAVAPYSTRAMPGASVALPLSWEELSPAIRADHFHIGIVPARLASLHDDPWSDFFKVRQSLTAKLKKKLSIARQRR